MAIKELEGIIEAQNILDSEDILEDHSHDYSFAPKVRPKAVVRAQSTDDVQSLVKWANESSASLIPLSSGAPHFKGDTVPSLGGSVIMDLSGMKKIFRLDEKNRIAMIEPGVTFKELIPQAEEQGLRLNLPLMPKPTKSIIGSMLDRDPVVMPVYQWDAIDPLTCIEVIFGTGELFRSGSAAGPGDLEKQRASRQAQLNPMGPGQTDFARVVQGSQGTMGIVTWATVRCEILPSIQKPFLVGSSTLDKIIELSYRLVWLKCVDEIFILNKVNLAAMLAQTPKEYNYLKANLPNWILFFCVAGYDYFPEEKVAYQEEAMAEAAQRVGLSPVSGLGSVSSSEVLRMVNMPSQEHYWKIRQKGSCQDLFFISTLDKADGFVDLMRKQSDEAGYITTDLGAYIQPMIQGTSCHVEFNMFYDPENKHESTLVQDLYVDAGESLMNAGGFFNRPYGALTDVIYQRDAGSTALLKQVKNIFDPKNVMNAGKLCF